MLRFSYAVQSDPPLRLPPGKSLLNYVTAVTLIAPDGSALSSGGGAYSSDASGAITEASKNSEKVDPRWPVVGVDIDVLDPAASGRASGRFAGPITIYDIPVPPEPDKVTPVHAEAEAPLGTRIIIEKVLISPKETGIKTTFVYRVVPDPAAPDLQFGASTNTLVVDDTGAKIGSYGMTGSGDLLPLKSALSPESMGMIYGAGVNGVPSPGAKTMRLTLDAEESSEQLKDDTFYRHFHLLIPLAMLNMQSHRAVPPRMIQQGKEVTGQVDTLTDTGGLIRLRLLLQDRTDPHIRWEAQSMKAINDKGEEAIGQSLIGTPFRKIGQDDFLWKADGTALLPGESAEESYFGSNNSAFNAGTGPAASAGTLTLSVNAEAVRKQDHLVDFSKLPIPADGQTLVFKRAASDAFGGKLILKKITLFSPAHPLPAPAPEGIGLSGLALVLTEPSVAGSRSPADYHPVDYQTVAATDTTGQHLRPVGSRERLEGDGPERQVTLFLQKPAAGAKTFSLRMGRTEQIDLHKTETLTFTDLPAPVHR